MTSLPWMLQRGSGPLCALTRDSGCIVGHQQSCTDHRHLRLRDDVRRCCQLRGDGVDRSWKLCSRYSVRGCCDVNHGPLVRRLVRQCVHLYRNLNVLHHRCLRRRDDCLHCRQSRGDGSDRTQKRRRRCLRGCCDGDLWLFARLHVRPGTHHFRKAASGHHRYL